jgi:hypothetical protein
VLQEVKPVVGHLWDLGPRHGAARSDHRHAQQDDYTPKTNSAHQ